MLQTALMSPKISSNPLIEGIFPILVLGNLVDVAFQLHYKFKYRYDIMLSCAMLSPYVVTMDDVLCAVPYSASALVCTVLQSTILRWGLCSATVWATGFSATCQTPGRCWMPL